jgi:hypothetical protein
MTCAKEGAYRSGFRYAWIGRYTYSIGWRVGIFVSDSAAPSLLLR